MRKTPEEWDKLFAFSYETIELQVEDKQGSYAGLDPRALYTSYADLISIFEAMGEAGDWVDLGAGLGQTALMYATLNPDSRAIAIDFSEARINAGEEVRKRLGLKNASLQCADLLNCNIPDGNTYFLYFPTGPVLDRILFELSKKRSPFRIVVIESHGDLIPRMDKVPWLRSVQSIPLKSARFHPEAIVYEALPVRVENPENPHLLSFQEKYLLINDANGNHSWGEWWAESFGLEWIRDDFYNLKHPPRTVKWGEVTAIKTKEEISPILLFLNSIRRLGEIRIITKESEITGFLRKIYSNPSFKLEISTGEQVEWENIIFIFQGQLQCYDSSSQYYFCPPVHTEL